MTQTIDFQEFTNIEILKHVSREINICRFYTDRGAKCRRLLVQEVDKKGNLWFFSYSNSDKQRLSKRENEVQLYFEQPDKSSYLIVNGEAKIVKDYSAIDYSCKRLAYESTIQRIVNPRFSLIKVNAQSVYYWNLMGNKCIRIEFGGIDKYMDGQGWM
jgi:general stress protein 26